MHPSLYLILLTSTCLAHYRGAYDSRNFIVREEPLPDKAGEYIECTVCDNSEQLLEFDDKCIEKGHKTYKLCTRGTYINEACGGRLDCYRGPGEKCTVKMNFDMYGWECAPGYYCDPSLGVCTGPEHRGDSLAKIYLNRYTFRRSGLKRRADEKYPFEGYLN